MHKLKATLIIQPSVLHLQTSKADLTKNLAMVCTYHTGLLTR